MNAPEPQCAGAVLLVRPATFAANPETSASNRFQSAPASGADQESVRAGVLGEFDRLAARLAEEIRVHAYADTPLPAKPDAVFPNNWFSTHADGSVVLYPMLAPNRRLERRRELLEDLERDGPYRVTRVVDLTHFEARGEFLEGTGSLVLDRTHRIAYACRSPRTHAAPLAAFARALEYELVAFDALGPDGTPVYHTNVLLCVADGFAVLCADAIPDAAQRRRVLARLAAAREVLTITSAQMQDYAGNMLAVHARDGTQLLELSQRACRALTQAQRQQLGRHCRALVTHSVPTIEWLGGGSVRCMLAEVFLPAA